MSLHLKKRWVTGPTCSELHNKRSSMDGRTPMAHNSGNKATLTSNLNKWENQNQLRDPAERMRRVSFKQRLYILVGGFNPFEKYESKWESSPNEGENKKIFETTSKLVYLCFQEKRSGSNFLGFVFLSF